MSGDFEEIYGAEDTDESEPHAGKWDAVLTCFFIDTVGLLLASQITTFICLIAGQEHCELPSCYPSHTGAGRRLDQSWYGFSLLQVRPSAPHAFTGPLLWHFENNSTNDPSVELDLEEVKALAHKIGFQLFVGLFLLLSHREA